MSNLPESLQIAIEKLTQNIDYNQLSQAREELSERYRHPIKNQLMTTAQHRLSYLFTRFPATFAAITSAVEAAKKRLPTLNVTSVLDLGSGPGTAMWALKNCFPDIETFTLIEKDQALMQLGKQLAQLSDSRAIQSAKWQVGDLETPLALQKHDLIILSYSIGELDLNIYPQLLDQCLEATKHSLLIVEPGTPVGFERIRFIRDYLISKDATIVAPCPHHSVCPMTNGDWCHFATRVERTSLHRRLKGGSLGYEDEKFSYLFVTKDKCFLPSIKQVLRHPEKHSGHVKLKLCTTTGLEFTTVSKKMGERYKQARHLEWGDAIVD